MAVSILIASNDEKCDVAAVGIMVQILLALGRVV